MGLIIRFIGQLTYVLICGIVYILLLNVLSNTTKSNRQFSQESDSDKTETIKEKLQVVKNSHTSKHRPKSNVKHILVTANDSPFCYLEDGQDIFNIYRCKYRNCYFTRDVKYLEDPSDFDAVLFSGCYMNLSLHRSPYKRRSPKQKYVFATIEPSPKFFVTHPLFDNFFNWTWTYRLSSDITWRYVTIYDLNGNAIGPAVNMQWPQNLKPIDEDLKIKLRLKTKAVAWFVSHCLTQNRREDFVDKFKIEIQKYGFTIDVFGQCGQFECGKSVWCFKMLEKYYHFYLSFEHVSDADYVTEKLLNALNNFAVPVVYGGANYSRFLHPSSYLNARELGPKKLAKIINDAMRNSTMYYDFFRWRNHLKYESSETSTELCNICAALNDKEKMKKSIITKFRSWWNTPSRQNIYEIVLKNMLSDKNLQKIAKEYNGSRESKLNMLENIIKQSNIPQQIQYELVNTNSLYE